MTEDIDRYDKVAQVIGSGSVDPQLVLILFLDGEQWLGYLPKTKEGKIRCNYFDIHGCKDDASHISLRFVVALTLFHEWVHLLQADGGHGVTQRPFSAGIQSRIVEEEADAWARKTFLADIDEMLVSGVLSKKDLPRGLQIHLDQQVLDFGI